MLLGKCTEERGEKQKQNKQCFMLILCYDNCLYYTEIIYNLFYMTTICITFSIPSIITSALWSIFCYSAHVKSKTILRQLKFRTWREFHCSMHLVQWSHLLNITRSYSPRFYKRYLEYILPNFMRLNLKVLFIVFFYI